MRRIVPVLSISALLLAVVGCGGGSSSSSSSSAGSVAGGNTIVTSGNNVAPLIVDAGPVPATNPQANVAFTTVVVCAPGTPTCVTIDHVMVDTGSTGLRIPATAFAGFSNGSAVLAALQNVSPTTPVAECVQFLDGSFFWGSVRSADIKMGGSNNDSEVASSVPIHVMGDPNLPTANSIPSTCSSAATVSGSAGAGEEDTVTALGANGLLGVGNYQYDCDILGYGNLCTSFANLPTGLYYYTCPSSSACSAPTSVTLNQQVRNPVALFTADNNGVIVELPSVPTGGQLGISAGQGSLVFGIGTQSNNALASSAVVLPLDSNASDLALGGFTTVYNGVSYPNSSSAISSFIDSGSNGLYFLDQPTTSIAVCDGGWYCPSSTESLTAINQATNGNSSKVQFNVSNADTLFNNNSGQDTAFSDLAAPNTSGVSTPQAEDGFFDWGLPFFYGRNVYVGIWGMTPPSGVSSSPYWAY